MVHPKVFFFLGFFWQWGDFDWPIIIFLIETLSHALPKAPPTTIHTMLCKTVYMQNKYSYTLTYVPT